METSGKTPVAPQATPTAADAPKRSEVQGLMRFSREMGWALAMALVFIVYVIQAFKIPTGSMENSLLVGDFLLGLKFIYGSPILPLQDKFGVTTRLPGLAKPKPGDIVIFKYPGLDKKDYIKRCVAGPGQVIQTAGSVLMVDGDTLKLPPRGFYATGGLAVDRLRRVEAVRRNKGVRGRDTLWAMPGDTAQFDTVFAASTRAVYFTDGDSVECAQNDPCLRDGQVVSSGEQAVDPRLSYFAPLRIPARGDTIVPATLPVREFVFFRHLVSQENPRAKVRTVARLYVNGEFANTRLIPWFDGNSIAFGDVPWDRIDSWLEIDNVVRLARAKFRGATVDIRWFVEVNGTMLDSYVVKKDNYFMMGDNRDNSLDSRFWGYLNRTNVKAKAFILYFSLDSSTPWALLPLKIRWNRIGKLIRSWDGVKVMPVAGTNSLPGK